MKSFKINHSKPVNKKEVIDSKSKKSWGQLIAFFSSISEPVC
jgi:hypothetical protein